VSKQAAAQRRTDGHSSLLLNIRSVKYWRVIHGQLSHWTALT